MLRKQCLARRIPCRGAVAAVLATALVGTLVVLHPRPIDHPLIRLNVDLGPDAIAGDAAISPDGTRLVFPARGPSGKPQR
jgi:hypothetical protein